MPPADPLFQRYPLTGPVQLSTGPAPAPYHIYAGRGVFISGSADLSAAGALLRAERLHPLTTPNARALMGVWALDFTDASLGPHHELQLSLFVTRTPRPPVPAHPLAVTLAMLTQPETRMLCHGLWNDTEPVVAYNRERLGLPARRCRSRLTARDGRLEFDFADAASGRPVVSGRLRLAQWSSLRAAAALLSGLGFAGGWRLAAQPWVEMKVVNPVGLRPAGDTALACHHSAVNALRFFDPRQDRLTIADETYRALDFQPAVVQHLDGIHFVYLDPQPE